MNAKETYGVSESEWAEFKNVAAYFGATAPNLLAMLIRSVNRHPDIIYDIVRESMRAVLEKGGESWQR